MGWRNLDDFLERVTDRLDPPAGAGRLAETGDIEFLSENERRLIRPAAVLVGIIPRASGATALLTLRPETMPDHAGQVAFPGGKREPGDADDVAAALREAEEEVGASAGCIDVLARSAPYVTGTRYRITPVVGLLPADFTPEPNPQEVAAVFETPLEFLMQPANHRMGEAFYKGAMRRYYEMPHNGYRIWGITAGIIRRLYEGVYEDPADAEPPAG
jgi:8-oxo-dGTP pyrophosphatase MutT (NUDIX family)